MNAVGPVIKWLFSVGVKFAFWGAMIFAFLPILTIVVAVIIKALNGSILTDLYYLIQMWLPFNLNTIFLWITTLIVFFGIWWIAVKIYDQLKALVDE